VVQQVRQPTDITLQKIKLGMSLAVSDILLDVSSETIYDYAYNQVRGHVRGFLWGEKSGRYTFKCPLDWWQAVKDRFAPTWFKRKWPVEFRTEVVDVTCVYPDMKISIPTRQHRLFVQRVNDNEL